MKEPCVYILASTPRGTLYVGSTTNLEQRVIAHKAGALAGFSKSFGVNKLVYYEFSESIEQMARRERAIKKWYRQWKLDLVEKRNPNWDDLASNLTST